MSEALKTRVELSVIVPLHNEEESIVLLYEAIKNAVAELGVEHEIIS